jgi:predicted Zn-dependent peptidase
MKRSQCVRVGMLVWMAMASWARAAVFQTTLENGLIVLIEENQANPVVSVQVFVRTGSI